MQKKFLVALIIVALALFTGMVYSLFKTACENSEGRILTSKDYGYEATDFSESIYIYTGSVLLFAGSGRILNDDGVIITEIKYSSGSAIMHRKLAISSGNLVQESQGVFKIKLASGAVVNDALSEDGKTDVFQKIAKNGFIEIIGSGAVLMSGDGNWDYLDETEETVKATFIEKAEDATKTHQSTTFPLAKLEAEDKNAIKLYLATGGELSELETKILEPERFGTPVKHFEEETVNSKTTEEDAKAEVEEETFVTEPEETESVTEKTENDNNVSSASIPSVSVENEENEAKNEEEEDSDSEEENSLYWGEYPDTDEGNYNLATDKLNPNYCQRITDSILRTTCEQTIYEALGKCDLLDDLSQNQACRNAQTKKAAISAERISKCAEIVDDENLKAECIKEINQIFYDTAIQNSDPNVCKAIYNAMLMEQCLTNIGEE